MFDYTDTNVEFTTIEPEYTAMWCEDKKELTLFYNNTIECSTYAATYDQASDLFNEWLDEVIQ